MNDMDTNSSFAYNICTLECGPNILDESENVFNLLNGLDPAL